MGKTFRYKKFTKYHYCEFSEEWEEDGVDFDYEVDNEKILPILVNILFDNYYEGDKNYCDNHCLVKAIKESLSRMIEDRDLIGELADQYEDTLKEIFEEEAMEWYNG